MSPSAERQTYRVAVFDFDGTSIRGQSGSLFTRYLIRGGMMSPLRALRLIWWGVRYKLHLPYRQDEARELVLGALRGRTANEVDALMVGFHDRILSPRYRARALAAVEECSEDGMVTLLVSATFDAIARVAAQRMGVDGFMATTMEKDERGNYTGAVAGPVVAGPEKYRAVARWCDERLGQGRWRLARAYGDHYSDRDLLARAQTAYAVCPGKTLRSLARRKHWEVLDWDV